MKEIQLKPIEYEIIAGMAAGSFRNDSARFDGGNFLCKCYVKAIVDYCQRKNLVISDGKILKKESQDGQRDKTTKD